MIPVVHVSLDDEAASERVRDSLAQALKGRVQLTTTDTPRPDLRVISFAQALASEVSSVPAIAMGDASLPAIVEAMKSRPWLNHVATSKVIDGKQWGYTLAAAVWRLVGDTTRLRTSVFTGAGFRGRRANIRRSVAREKRCDAIFNYAKEVGAPGSVAEQIREIADELLTNALYDAPAERAGVKADRSSTVVLEKNDACNVIYGASTQMFYLRVHDGCGSLRRNRLIEVLARCAKPGGTSLDESGGGAGLGLWRIFNGASLVVIETRPQYSTEFLVGIDIERGRRSSRGKAIHLFFEPGAEGNQ